MMFVDASAIVAILTREPEADALADLLEAALSPITSPIAIFEATLGICRKRQASVEEAAEEVREFLGLAGVRAVPITDQDAETALAAFSRFGKGRGHPAQLNLGLLCLCGGKEQSGYVAVQGRGLRQDRHLGRPSTVLM